jgi:hypothetical protein
VSFLILDTSTSATSTYWDQITQLDGIQYTFEFVWSARETCWYLNLLDQSENQLAMGLRLNVSWPLLRRFKNPALPQGILICIDTTGSGTDIQAPADLGQRVLLEYITADDPLLANGHVGVVLKLAAGFTVAAGALVASQNGDPRLPSWTNEDAIANPSNTAPSTVTVAFVASQSGNVSLPADTLEITGTYNPITNIVSPGSFPGVQSINNPAAAIAPIVK